MLIGQSASERRRERLGGGAAGLGRRHQHGGRGHVQAAGGGTDHAGAERLEERETAGVAFHGSGVRRPRRRRRGRAWLVGVTGQLGFVRAPGARLGAAFGGFDRLHQQTHGQRRRRLRDRLRGRHGQRQRGVRRRSADAVYWRRGSLGAAFGRGNRGGVSPRFAIDSFRSRMESDHARLRA